MKNFLFQAVKYLQFNNERVVHWLFLHTVLFWMIVIMQRTASLLSASLQWVFGLQVCSVSDGHCKLGYPVVTSHPFRFYIHGLCLEWLRKNSENLSIAGVPQRFKPGTLQIQETSVTAQVNLLFVAVGRLNVSCVRCHQIVPFFWWLCAIYRVSINFRQNKKQISLPIYITYGESSLSRYVSYLTLFKDSFPRKSWIRGLL